MRTNWQNIAPAFAGVIVSILIAAPAPAQRPDAPDRPAIGDRPRDGALAERLRNRIEDLDEERAELRDAIERLEAGEDERAVREELMSDRGKSLNHRGDRRWVADDDRLLELLGEIDPGAINGFEELRERNPRFAHRLLHAAGPRLLKIDRLRDDDPDLYRIEAEQFRIDRLIMQTARSLHGAVAGDADTEEPASIDEAREQLRELVGRKVDLEIEARRLRLVAAEEKLQQLRESIEERDRSRENAVNERVDRILERAVRTGVDRRQRRADP